MRRFGTHDFVAKSKPLLIGWFFNMLKFSFVLFLYLYLHQFVDVLLKCIWTAVRFRPPPQR